MAKPVLSHAHNHFGNVVIGLYPQLQLGTRVEPIGAELADAHRRFGHPAGPLRRPGFCFSSRPAPALGVARFTGEAKPLPVTGNTVVSSLRRGAADLRFGDAPVIPTADTPRSHHQWG